MASLVEIEKIQNSIMEMKGHLELVRQGLEGIEKEVDILSTKAIQLEKNIKYMKKDKVVALVSEYGIAKTTLAKVRRKLAFIKADRENHRTAYAKIELEIAKMKGALFVKIQAQTNNVVYGPFLHRGQGPRYDG